MEFEFVETEEFKEFKKDLRRAIWYFKKMPLQIIFGSLLFYLFIVSLIILLP